MAQVLISIVISVALSALSYYLLKQPNPKNPVKDEKPATIASRGAFIPIVIGRRRVGAVVGWVGGHFTAPQIDLGTFGKGSGSKSPKVLHHFEDAWHILCVGPAFALHRILLNGKAIWSGPIYRSDTPSGSSFSAGIDGFFTIYWGEEDQPINSHIGAADKIGISSRWPYVTYVVWDPMQLGPSWNWPIIDYDIEVRPEFSSLTDSQPWTEATSTLQVDEAQGVLFIEGVGGTYGDDIIAIRGRHTTAIQIGSTVLLKDNSVNADGDRIVSSISYEKSLKATLVEVTSAMIDDIPSWFPGYHKPLGYLAPYRLSPDDGANPAHILDQLLFEEYPHGLGLRGQTDVPFNVASLEALGVLTSGDNESLLFSFMANSGEEAMGSIATLMQDVGILFRFNRKVGVFEFLSVRKPTLSAIPHASQDMLMPPEPEIATLIGDRPRDKLVFKFSDRTRNFRDNVIVRDDDSAANHRGHVKTVEVQMPNIIEYTTAVTVAERRSQEEYGNIAAISMHMNREGRALLPGDVFTIDVISSVLRVLEMQIDPRSSKVRVDVILDFYGVQKSEYEDGVAGGPAPIDTEVGGDQFTFIEIPAYLNREQEVNIVVPRIRANNQVLRGTIHISRDDATYISMGAENASVSGGQLAEDIAIGDDVLWAEGPQFLAVGPDISGVMDLSGDDLNWRLGRQLCIIDEEIFFLQKITAMGDDLYRLDNLVRARYDTVRAAHTAGTYVYIFPISNLNVFGDLLMDPNKTLYVKSQPETVETLDLSEIDAVSKTLVGKGIGPVAPLNLRTQNMRNDYATGTAIPLWWAYRSTAVPKTGAGLQGGGEPTSPSPIQGEFVLRFYDSTGVTLKREVSGLTTLEYTYSNSDLVSDYGGEPASFVLRLTNVKSGLESAIEETTIVKV